MHPNWYTYVDTLCSGVDYYRPVVMLATNGKWLGTDDDEHKIRSLCDKHSNFVVQVTAVKGIYKDYDKTVRNYHSFKGMLINPEQIVLASQIEAMVSLGRANNDKQCSKLAEGNNRKMMSCFTAALVNAQTKDYEETIRILEDKSKFCHPLVDWKGGVHWSESWLCPAFYTIPGHLLLDLPMYKCIAEAAHAWRPCGACPDYQKLLKNNYPLYVLAKHILGIPQILGEE